TGVPGTGWAIDPATSQVTVWTDDSVKGAQMAAVRRMAQRMGPAIRTVRIDARLRTFALGGDAIFGQGPRCSLGFTVQRGGQYFCRRAGHCGHAVRNCAADPGGSQLLGTTVASSFPGNAFALVRSAQAGPSAVNLYNGRARRTTQGGNAVVG